MALLDFSTSQDASPSLVEEAVLLRSPRLGDYDAWRLLREQSHAHLTRWEPDWTPEEVTYAAYRERVKSYSRSVKRGVAVPYFIFDRDNDALIGGVTIINILRGAAQSASIGYWIGLPHIRRGYARMSVSAALDHAFLRLGLNRIEAACQPDNRASVALLDSMGFRQEGYAREYLHINGQWRDHLIYVMIASDRIKR